MVSRARRQPLTSRNRQVPSNCEYTHIADIADIRSVAKTGTTCIASNGAAKTSGLMKIP